VVTEDDRVRPREVDVLEDALAHLYVSIRQHTSAYVRIREDTSGYVDVLEDASGLHTNLERSNWLTRT
jgi:hypothetical protein